MGLRHPVDRERRADMHRCSQKPYCGGDQHERYLLPCAHSRDHLLYTGVYAFRVFFFLFALFCLPLLVLGIVSTPFLDGYCSTVQGLLDWFEVDLGFTELLVIQIDLCVMCVFVLGIVSTPAYNIRHNQFHPAWSCRRILTWGSPESSRILPKELSTLRRMVETYRVPCLAGLFVSIRHYFWVFCGKPLVKIRRDAVYQTRSIFERGLDALHVHRMHSEVYGLHVEEYRMHSEVHVIHPEGMSV